MKPYGQLTLQNELSEIKNFICNKVTNSFGILREFPKYFWIILFISYTSQISFCSLRLFVAWSTPISQFPGIISPNSIQTLCKTKEDIPIFCTLSFQILHFLNKMLCVIYPFNFPKALSVIILSRIFLSF